MKADYDIDISYSFSSQFKCLTTIIAVAQSSVVSTRIYFRTSHPKSMNDRLKVVVKSYVPHVCSSTVGNAREQNFNCP